METFGNCGSRCVLKLGGSVLRGGLMGALDLKGT